MAVLLKEDLITYLAENDFEDIQSLLDAVRSDIRFQDVSEGVVENRLRRLRDESLVEGLSINWENGSVYDYLGFIYWSKHRNVKWRDLVEENCRRVFKVVLEEGRVSLNDLTELSDLSRPTVSKYVDLLEENGFVKREKQKPLILTPQMNDKSIFYVNLYGFTLASFSNRFKELDFDESGEKFKREIAKIHTYSTTVTEGNTATEKEVEQVLGNFSTDLTPREILEIENSNRAVEELYELRDREVTLERLKELNDILVTGLVNEPGVIKSGGKRIAGSSFSPPSRRLTIKSSLKALENFIGKYSELKPEVLGALAHFIFVSIHPFEDGNGRTGRLLHSWILLREGKPLFVYDPEYQQTYFQRLQEGNREDVSGFIEFCISRQEDCLEKMGEGQG